MSVKGKVFESEAVEGELSLYESVLRKVAVFGEVGEATGATGAEVGCGRSAGAIAQV